MNEKKVFWSDGIRATACTMVIVVHVAADNVNQYGNVDMSLWWIGNIWQSLGRPCVPLFVMLTGALVLNKSYELTTFLQKVLSRLVIPLVFWSAFYFILEMVEMLWTDGSIYAGSAIQLFSRAYFDGKPYFWYMYMIIGLYLFIPIISLWVRSSSESQILYFLIIWLITILLGNYFPKIDFRYFSGYLGYLILGYYLAKKDFQPKRIVLLSLVMVLVGFLSTVLGTYIMSIYTGSLVKVCYFFFAPNVLVSAIGIFLLFKYCDFSSPTLSTLAHFISVHSYLVYFVHFFVLSLTHYLGWHLINPLLGLPAAILLCMVISLAIAFGIRRMPFGKYLSN